MGDRSEGSISFSEPSLPMSSGTKTEGIEDDCRAIGPHGLIVVVRIFWERRDANEDGDFKG